MIQFCDSNCEDEVRLGGQDPCSPEGHLWRDSICWVAQTFRVSRLLSLGWKGAEWSNSECSHSQNPRSQNLAKDARFSQWLHAHSKVLPTCQRQGCFSSRVRFTMLILPLWLVNFLKDFPSFLKYRNPLSWKHIWLFPGTQWGKKYV